MLIKTTIREIKNSFARYLAIFAIIALGVGFFVGLKVCRTDMVDTAKKYLEEHNLYDYEVLSSYGVDEDSIKIAKNTPGVTAAELSTQQDILAKNTSRKDSSETVLRAISIPEKINTIRLTEGRMPEKNNECIIDNYNALGADYDIGDTIALSSSNNKSDLDVFKKKSFTIVGKATSPLYLNYQRGSSNVGDGAVEVFLYVDKSAFDLEYGTQMYVTLDINESVFTDDYENELEAYEQSMESLAKKITKARRTTAQKQGQKMLDKEQSKYDEGLAKYNLEKANADSKIAKGQRDIEAGRDLANKSEKEVKATLSTLESNKRDLEKGISDINEAKATLQQAHAAGLIEDDYYNEALAELNGQLSQLKSQLGQVNSGISQANAALDTIKNKRKELDKSEEQLSYSKKRAKTEFEKAKAELDKAEAALEEAEEKIKEMETGNSYSFSRKDNSGYSTFRSNADIVSNVAKIFPLFFFLVAALVVMTTMTRMIDEQRSQIGVLRALGFKNGSIRRKYLFYSGSASIIGAVAGFFAGSHVFPNAIWKAYTIMYDFTDKVNILYDWKLGAIATVVALICAMGATWFSCAKEFREAPAELIRPKAPPAGKKILLEKFTALWSSLGFMQKVSLRNVFRYKKRFIMMLLGICGCTALLVASFGMRTSISGIAQHQYDEIEKYDYQLAFDKNMNEKDQKEFIKDTKAEVGNYGDIMFLHRGEADLNLKSGKRELILLAFDGDISNFVDLHYEGSKVKYPGEGEVALCRKMQDQCGVKIGDVVTIKDGYYEMNATVSAFYDNYVMETMIMTASTYEKGMGKAPSIKTAYVAAPDKLNNDEIRQQATDVGQHDRVVATVVAQDIIEQINSMMKSMNSIVYVVILCAGILAFVVLYNLTNINILERIREIATIKVLGFYNNETTQYVFRENFILTAIAAAIGLPVGKLLLKFVINSINIDMMFFVPKLLPMDYVLAFVVTFIFTLIVNIVMKPKIGKISMTESLKIME